MILREHHQTRYWPLEGLIDWGPYTGNDLLSKRTESVYRERAVKQGDAYTKLSFSFGRRNIALDPLKRRFSSIKIANERVLWNLFQAHLVPGPNLYSMNQDLSGRA